MNTIQLNTRIVGATPSGFGKCLAAFALMVTVGLTGCGGDGTESDEKDPQGATAGGEPGALTASDCASFARGGSVDICHATGVAAAPFAALKVSSEACQAAHAGHAEDFVDRDSSGCKLAKPAAACKGANSTCTPSKAGACCSQFCQCGLDGRKCRCL